MINSTTSSGGVADTTTSTSPTLAGGAMGKNEFLKLLIAQLQHQDPMNPMQGDQMAAQLAQFSSLEQLQQINTTLSDQSSSAGSLLGAVQASAAINTIGHTVVAASDQLVIGGASGMTSVTANFAGAADTATLHILNSAGVEVGTRSLGSVTAGKHSFGLGDAAKGLKDGNYTFTIDASDAAGEPVALQTYTTGRVSGISSGASGVVLNIGAVEVPYSGVIQILD